MSETPGSGKDIVSKALHGTSVSSQVEKAGVNLPSGAPCELGPSCSTLKIHCSNCHTPFWPSTMVSFFMFHQQICPVGLRSTMVPLDKARWRPAAPVGLVMRPRYAPIQGSQQEKGSRGRRCPPPAWVLGITGTELALWHCSYSAPWWPRPISLVQKHCCHQGGRTAKRCPHTPPQPQDLTSAKP